jgi:hypothetical protein
MVMVVPHHYIYGFDGFGIPIVCPYVRTDLKIAGLTWALDSLGNIKLVYSRK